MKRPRVLLIDDDTTLLAMYSLKFRTEGSCDLLTAASPEQGINLASQERPDLILLDLVLPKTEQAMPLLNQEVGFQLLQELKSNPATKTTPVIVFTNLDERSGDNIKRALFLGAYDYWIKAHWPPATTVEKVKEVLKLLSNRKR